MYNWRAEYDALLRELPRLVAAAAAGDTGRPEDDLFARVAILGFGRHAAQDEWGWDHLLEVRRWRDGDYSDEALSSYGPTGGKRYALLACAWLGTVLGLFHRNVVSETEALTAYALLVGFVAVDAFEVLERDFG
jgi:hypothetical protein